ncbi:MAG: IS6 family transposase [Gammaproteobacteria bacterium]
MLNFKGRHFPKDIILMGVRWYVAYSLSTRDIEELMLERGIKVDHASINRWVIQYSPLLETQFRKKYKSSVGSSWRMDETYVKVKGQWHYLYRAVDKAGQTIDFMLSEKRDKKAAIRFFIKAIATHGLPDKITIDKSGANKSALKSLNTMLTILSLMLGFIYLITIRDIKYLNNIVEQDHRGIKRIVKPMMGFKAFHTATATLAGIELHRMLRKGQHKNTANMTVFEQFYALAE